MVKSIEALARGMQVLDEIRRKSPMTLSELHKRTHISKATLLRILKTLQESGWIYKTLGDAQYRLSYTVSSAISDSDAYSSIAELAAPIINDVQEELQWPVDIAVRDGLSMKIIETTRSKAAFVLNRQVMGNRPPFLFSGIGRAYLAFCPDEEAREIIAGLKAAGGKEGKLARDQVWLSRLLGQTRQQGYGVREPAYFGIGSTGGRQIEAIAVPVFGHNKVIATLSMAWPQGSVNQQAIETRLYPRLKAAADQLSSRTR